MSYELENKQSYVRILNESGSSIDFATQTSLSNLSNKIPASVGAKLSASSLSVVLASDHSAVIVDGSASIQPVSSSQLPSMLGSISSTGSLSVVLSSDHASVPVQLPVVGSQGNAYNAVTTTGANEKSNSVDIQYCNNVTVIGNINLSTTVTAEFSQDDTNWYTTLNSIVLPSSGNFQFSFTCACRYVRLDCSSSACTITASICAKI